MNVIQNLATDKTTPPVIFWGEIAPCENLAQIYTNTGEFLNILEKFVGNGLQAGESVIVIATLAHLIALHERLTLRGFNLEGARDRQQYIPLEAREALAKFIVRGWPDDQRFEQFVGDLLEQARRGGRRVRAFGEMVAVLWAAGQSGAMLRLEQLWQQLCQKEGFSLLCVYPPPGFTQDVEASVQEICATHAKLITM